MTDRNVCPTGTQASGRGFTLVELLVCMLLVMIVSVGISQVFTLTRTTVGTGMKVADMTRDVRSATAIMQRDGQRWAKDAPLFFIRSSIENLTTDSDMWMDQRVTPAVPMVYRRDMMGFPMRGQFHRATGDPGSFVGPEASGEAWVWYGHCNVVAPIPRPLPLPPYQNSSWPPPGPRLTATLGRVSTLLMDPNSIPNKTNYYQRVSNVWLSPLRIDSDSTAYGEGIRVFLPSSRYDLAGTTLLQLKNDVESYKQSLSVPPEDNWWIDPTGSKWWGAGLSLPNSNLFVRYQCSERMVNTSNYSQAAIPPTSDSYALTTPVFLRNAPEFIVEFAGNFVTQDTDPTSPTYGSVIDNKPDPDGTITFTVVRDNSGAIVYPIQRRTQWFGMFRDQLATNGKEWSAEPVGQWMKDHWSAKAGRPYTTKENPYFERQVAGINPAPGDSSVWVWVNEAPKMIRVLIKQEDPEGLIRVGPWTEFIMGPQ